LSVLFFVGARKAADEQHLPTPCAIAVIPAKAGFSTAELVIHFDLALKPFFK